MKSIFTFVLIVFSSFLFSQDFVGKFYKKSEPINAGPLIYTLILNPDNTYQIEIHRRINKEDGPDEYFKGTGEWKQNKKIISFYPQLTHDKMEIDMSTVTARFDIKNKKQLVFFTKQKVVWDLNVGMEKL